MRETFETFGLGFVLLTSFASAGAAAAIEPPPAWSSQPAADANDQPDVPLKSGGLGKESTPRLRFGADLSLGGNGFYNGGNSMSLFGPHGEGGIGISLQLGVQLEEVLGFGLEILGDGGDGEGLRATLFASFVPVDWLSIGLGPAVGINGARACPVTSSAGSSPSACGDSTAGYMGGEFRIDFLLVAPPWKPPPRIRRSFDVALEAVAAGTVAPGAPSASPQDSWGFYLLVGYLQY